MHLKLFTTFFFTFILCITSFSQTAPSIQWQKCYGGTLLDYATSILQTPDSGYIVVGVARSNNGDVSFNNGGLDWWVIKLDGIGAIVWQRSLGGLGDENLPKILHSGDGGYIIAGHTGSSNSGDVGPGNGVRDGWIVKLDANGVILWNKLWGGTDVESFYDIIKTSDGGFITVGSTSSTNGLYSQNHGGTDWWVTKLDSVANIQWMKLYGGTGNEEAYAVDQTYDGGYIITGRSNSFDGDVINMGQGNVSWIIKVDSVGIISWQKAWEGQSYQNSIEQTIDSGYIWAGVCESNVVPGWHGQADAYVVRMDKTGNIVWHKVLGGSNIDIAVSAKQTSDGEFLVLAETSSNNGDVSDHLGGIDVWLIKLSSGGVINWQKCYGGMGSERSYKIEPTFDGGFIAAASTTSNNSGNVGTNHGIFDFWIVKFSPNGTIPVLLTKFDVVLREDHVLCTWQTLQEQNSSHFIVERSFDGIAFHEVGRVNATGNSSSLSNYLFTDENLRAGINFYRLKMVDEDNSFSISEVRQVNNNIQTNLVLFPNPATQTIHANIWSDKPTHTTYSIIDMEGREILSRNVYLNKGNNNFEVDANHLPSGSYYYKIQLVNGILIKRFKKI